MNRAPASVVHFIRYGLFLKIKLFSCVMEQMNTHILLINCPDESGLIYKVSRVVYNHKLNVVSNGEFVERKFSHFFMRTEFSGDFDTDILLKEIKEVLPGTAEVRLIANAKKKVVILVTKEYHCLHSGRRFHSASFIRIKGCSRETPTHEGVLALGSKSMY